MEATIWTEALRCQRVALGDSASPQAATCERCAGLETGNAEADPPEKRGRLPAAGKRATEAPVGSAGVLAVACGQEGEGSNTGSPAGGVARVNREPVRVSLGRRGGGEARSTREAG